MTLHLSVLTKTIVLLTLSNVFMTFAWYAHLRNLSHRPLQVPANRIGRTELDLGQLKILQEVITLAVFVPFAWLYMKEPVRLNFLWAGLCLCAAVYFAFRK